MDTENTSQIVSSQEASPSSEEDCAKDLITEDEQCTCADDNESCVYCAVKEYQEALQQVRSFSQEREMRRRRERHRCSTAMLRIRCSGKNDERKCRNFTISQKDQTYDRDSQQTEIYDRDLKQTENCDTDLQLTEDSHTELLQNENCDTDLQSAENCRTEFQQDGIYDTDLKQTENCGTDLHSTENFHPELQYTQNSGLNCRHSCSLLSEKCHTNSHVNENRTDTHRSHICNTDTQQSENSYPDSEHFKTYHTILLQQNKLIIKSEPCDMDTSSDPSLSDNTKDSEHYCDNLEHSSKMNHSNDFKMAEIKREIPDAHICTDTSSQDMRRVRRISKRKRDVEDHCPVCGLTVRYSELSSHFEKEVENLSNIPKNIRKPRGANKEKDGVNITFVQVKCNRENRLAAKVAKYSKKNEVQCPVCHVKLTGSEIQVNEHVLNCVGEDDDSMSDVNVVDRDDSFEEYEFGNETRVRAISFVPGGYRSLLGQSCTSKPANEEDDDDDLNVDIDDTLTYGKAQYSELDVIHNTSTVNEMKELDQLRRAVMFDPAAEPHEIECKKWTQECEIKNEIARITGSKIEHISKSGAEEGENISKSGAEEGKDAKEGENGQKNESDIISSLKAKIRDLEQQKNVKCLICLEPYTKPTVATTCWHVHCEECWLVSMGVKKLCPQCNTIVFPTNLRRIYL